MSDFVGDGEYRGCGRYHMHPEDQTAAIVFGALGMIFGLLALIISIAASFK